MIIAILAVFVVGVLFGIYAALCVASDADDRMDADGPR